MQKIVISTVLAITLVALAQSAAAARPNSLPPIPEKNGLYDDPDHPGVKVRVFAHPERPTKTESDILVCNLSDPDSSAAVPGAGWKLPASWTYNLNPGSVPSSVGSANLATIAANSFSDWATAANNSVSVIRGSNTTVSRQAYDQKNIVAWGRLNGSALGITYIRYYPSTGQVVDIDTIMNKKFSWKWSGSNSCADSSVYDAENILTHEFGHSFGLDDVYSATYVDNTMYGYGSKGEVKKNTLTTGDIAGAAALY